ncbi:polysaccharide biosynthesis tyrosine autokinase [Cupriavidus sp. RAF12]|uniref:polysaccharide biosynthesis tyrosine autokinase n=1 Tax=Cupriavidus sp. RAF12 TaxID=3233050 RepID=UPI003F8F9719
MSSAGTMPAPGGVSRRRGAQVRALLDHAGWILAAGLVGAIIAGAAAISRPYVYRAHTLVQVYPKDEPAAAQQTAPFDVGMLRSRAVVGPVVERLRLDISVEPLRAPLVGGVAAHFAEPGKRIGPWPAQLGYAWGGEQLDVRTFNVPEHLLNVPMTLEVLPTNTYRLRLRDATVLEGNVGEIVQAEGVTFQVARIDANPGTRFTVTRHETAQTIDTVARELRIDSDGNDASTVRIAWQNADRAVVAALINGIADSYINGQAARRRDEAAATLAFLTGEMPRVRSELERAEAALTRYRSRAGSMQPSQDAQSFLNGSMDYQRQIALLRLERTKMLQRFTEESNEVRTIDNQIQQLARERRDMDTRLQNLSISERESVALTRDVKVAEDMYMTLRNKLEHLSLAQLDRTHQTRVIDSALTPVTPVGMGRLPLTAGGGLLGICLAMGFVSVRQRMKPTVANANDAEESLGLPMLGDIAYSREQAELDRLLDSKTRTDAAVGVAPSLLARLERPQPGRDLAEISLLEDEGTERLVRLGLHDQFLLARNAPHSVAVEGLRSVRAALHFSLRGTRDNVVAVTSPTAGAGKTFASVNLAVLFAEAGQRVLLIDADLRRGRVASWFDQPPGPGLAEVLAGRAVLPEAVRLTVVNGLSMLPAGTPPANPSELLMRPALAECLRACAERFDLVLIDTSPVMAVADATLVANLAGSTLLVLRAESTLPTQVEDTLKRLARADARLLGGILNGVTPKRSNRADFGSMNPYLGMPVAAPEVKQIGHTAVVEDKKA